MGTDRQYAVACCSTLEAAVHRPSHCLRRSPRAAEQHDLGYDLLRHAAVVGHPLPGSARRAIDDQLETTMRASCSVGGHPTPSTAARLRCTAWAEVAMAAVRSNSWRQGWSVPGHESVASIAEGSGAVGTAGAASVLLVGGAGPTRRRRTVRSVISRAAITRTPITGTRTAWSRIAHSRIWDLADHAPRVSTTVTAALAACASVFPGLLPRSALLQGLATVVFVAADPGDRPAAASLDAEARPSRARVVVAGSWHGRPGTGALVGGPQAGCPAGRSRRDTRQHPALGGGRCHRRRGGPAGVRRAAGGEAAPSSLAAVRGARRDGSAHGACRTGPGDHAEVASDRVLTTSSPLGAVRAYAAERPDETLRQRALRVADDLVARGGLTKSRVVVMVPTGSGWVDPAAVDGFERRFHGDVALVGMQYAATPSWVAFLFQRDVAEQGARELEKAVADRIARLPLAPVRSCTSTARASAPLLGRRCWPTPSRPPGSARRSGWARPAGPPPVVGGRPAWPTPPTPSCTRPPCCSVPTSGGPWLPGVSFVQAAFDYVEVVVAAVRARPPVRRGPGRAPARLLTFGVR